MIRPDREIKVYKVEHSIYFANCKTFAENIYKLNQLKPSIHVQPSVLHQKSLNKLNDDDDLNDEAPEDRKRQQTTNDSFRTAETDASLVVRHVSVNRATQTNNVLIDIHENPPLTHDFILDFSAVNYIDTNGIQVVEELIEDFQHLGAFVYICRPQESFIRIICRLGLVDKFDAHVFLSVEDAVRHFNQKSNSS